MASNNAFVQVNLTVTKPDNDTIQIAIGPNTYTVEINRLKEIFFDRNESVLRTYLLCQMALVLQQAGLDPRTATLQQMKTAIESKQFWV